MRQLQVLLETRSVDFEVAVQLCRRSSSGLAPSKEDKEALRQKELKQMKAKYGLQVSVASCRLPLLQTILLLSVRPIALCAFCLRRATSTRTAKR